MATKILSKQLINLNKTTIPNIKVLIDDKNITKIEVVFYYNKSKPSSEFPFFLPKGYMEPIMIKAEVDLTDFPNKPPKMMLLGDVPHSHVFKHSEDKYVICFSLDESYQWYFGSQKHMTSSRFNPSITVDYYLMAVYKFLAEDDMEHPPTEERKKDAVEFWKKYLFKQEDKPTQTHTYEKCLALFNKDDKQTKEDTNSLLKKITELHNITPPVNVMQLKDFVDKEYLLCSTEPVVFGINYQNKSNRHIYTVSGVDLMRKSTFDNGIRKTSLGVDFTHCFPVVIHSQFWKTVDPIKVLDELATNTLGKIRVNPILKIKDKVSASDMYLYIISELFNELAIDVFSERMFPCEEVLKSFMYLHHAILMLSKISPDLLEKGEKILDTFEASIDNRDKTKCPNLGVLMTQYLMTQKKRDYNCLLDEMYARNCLWSLMKPKDCKKCIQFDKDKKTFNITDIELWIDLTWKNSVVGMQRFAFQQLYNNKFNKETLETVDSKFGCVEQKDIELFQAEVKKLASWKNLKGREGYKTFLEYFGLDDKDLDKKMKDALLRSSACKYHDFVVAKQWKYNK